MNDISTIMRLHLEDLVVIARRYQGAADAQGIETLLGLIVAFPGLTANVIACAADEDDATQFHRIPVGLQIAALQKINELTCEDFGGPGKFWAAVQSVIQAGLAQVAGATGLPPQNLAPAS